MSTVKQTEKNTSFSEPIRSKKTRISGEKRMGANSDAHATSENIISNIPNVESTVLTVSVDRAATMLGVHRSTLYEACRTNQFPHIQVGKTLRISTDVVKRMLAGDEFISLKEHERRMGLFKLTLQHAYNRKVYQLHLDIDREVMNEMEELI